MTFLVLSLGEFWNYLTLKYDLSFSGKDEKGKPPTLLEWYAITFLALLRKGYNMKNSNRRTKITYISILLFGMVLFRLWKAMLISFFSVPSRTFPFHSLEEFLSKTDKKVNVSLVYFVILENKNQISLWKSIDNRSLLMQCYSLLLRKVQLVNMNGAMLLTQ